MSVKVLGKCNLCGGKVVIPTVWFGIKPPVPTCEKCGAVEDDTAKLPTLPMRPNKRKVWSIRNCSGIFYGES